MSLDALHAEFQAQATTALRLRVALLEQLENLFLKNEVTLGTPLEGRVKTWESIAEKIQRKSLLLERISDLDDLVGIRAILLFKPDLTRVEELLRSTLDVLQSEDASTRLNESQFGYQSRHFIIKLPAAWLTVPSLAGLGELKAEIQVRTLAQHIWAAASHKLQYKNEANVPPPLRRSIHRLSALLETVDLEFERLLGDRNTYVEIDIAKLSENEPLNVDVVQALLSELLPTRNLSEREPYAELLEDLVHFDVKTAEKLRALVGKHLNAVLDADARIVAEREQADIYWGATEERIAAGVYFTHTGLAREALCEEFGHENVKSWLQLRSDGEG